MDRGHYGYRRQMLRLEPSGKQWRILRDRKSVQNAAQPVFNRSSRLWALCRHHIAYWVDPPQDVPGGHVSAWRIEILSPLLLKRPRSKTDRGGAMRDSGLW